MMRLDPDLVAAALKNLAATYAERNEETLANFEIYLIDHGMVERRRKIAMIAAGMVLAARNERNLRETEAWLATNPQPGDRMRDWRAHRA